MCHVFSTLRSQETLVNGQTLFTADRALFIISQWHMDPWVLFQLSEQQPELGCSHLGGSLIDLHASVRGGEREGDRVRQCVHNETANFENVKKVFPHRNKSVFLFSIQQKMVKLCLDTVCLL